tara:strand:- start:483 stop:710 length:228 start_codon:yes stop_codon:yes gene_type:complete
MNEEFYKTREPRHPLWAVGELKRILKQRPNGSGMLLKWVAIKNCPHPKGSMLAPRKIARARSDCVTFSSSVLAQV